METPFPAPRSDGDTRADPADPTADPATPDEVAPERPSRRERIRSAFDDRPADTIVGGVAADVAERLGLDVVWVRLAFVVLLLVGGFGALVYAALWLVLVVGRSQQWARLVGGGITVVGVPLFLANGPRSLWTGTGAVVVLLVGLAFSLWRPGFGTGLPSGRPVADRIGTADRSDPLPTDIVVARAIVERSTPRRRIRRPPSILGRATLGLAVVTAAAGALVDELNGGRTHPEQWLGAAAAVCGVGLLVGAVRGHATWLVVPAIALCGAGYVGGEVAANGLEWSDVGASSYVTVDAQGVSNDGIVRAAFGDAGIEIVEVPDTPVRIDVRSVFGDVYISSPDDVTIELISDVDNGTIRVQGQARNDGRIITGPGGEPDVIVDMRVVSGDVQVNPYSLDEVVAPGEFDDVDGGFDENGIEFGDGIPVTTSIGQVTVGDGIVLLSDGRVILADGQAVIGPDDTVEVGQLALANGGGLSLDTDVGFWTFRDGVLTSPFGEEYRLAQLRAQFAAGGGPVDSAVPVPEGQASDDITPPSTAPPVVQTPPHTATTTTTDPQEG